MDNLLRVTSCGLIRKNVVETVIRSAEHTQHVLNPTFQLHLKLSWNQGQVTVGKYRVDFYGREEK